MRNDSLKLFLFKPLSVCWEYNKQYFCTAVHSFAEVFASTSQVMKNSRKGWGKLQSWLLSQVMVCCDPHNFQVSTKCDLRASQLRFHFIREPDLTLAQLVTYQCPGISCATQCMWDVIMAHASVLVLVSFNADLHTSHHAQDVTPYWAHHHCWKSSYLTLWRLWFSYVAVWILIILIDRTNSSWCLQTHCTCMNAYHAGGGYCLPWVRVGYVACMHSSKQSGGFVPWN